MKSPFVIVLLTLFLSFSLRAQRTSSYTQGPATKYEIVKQDAKKPWLNLSFDFLNMDFPINNIDGASFNFGLRGYMAPIDPLGVDFNFRRSWLTGGFSGSNTDFELGVHYHLTNSIKTKRTKIILDYDIAKDYNYDGTGYTETISSTSIFVTAERRVIRAARAGLITKSGPFGIDDVEGVIEGDATLSSSGFYIGLVQKSLINVFADVDGWGRQFNSGGRDIIFDLLVIPTNNFTFSDTKFENGSSTNVNNLNTKIDGGSIGFRVMYDIYQIEKKEFTGKSFGSSYRFEFGSKPYQGLYFGFSWGITLIKAVKRPF